MYIFGGAPPDAHPLDLYSFTFGTQRTRETHDTAHATRTTHARMSKVLMTPNETTAAVDPPCTLSDDMGAFLEKGELADVTFLVDKEPITAHSLILQVRYIPSHARTRTTAHDTRHTTHRDNEHVWALGVHRSMS
jgi:hypothetical protein